MYVLVYFEQEHLTLSALQPCWCRQVCQPAELPPHDTLCYVCLCIKNKLYLYYIHVECFKKKRKNSTDIENLTK